MKKKLKVQALPKIIFTDFDGCLTDDRVWLNQEGEEFVAANRKDGLAINRLKKLGITVVITSSETNKVVSARAKKLGVEVLQGLSNKVEAIEKYLDENGLNWASSWYIGNDVNDLDAIRKAEIGICPSDAVKLIRREADHKLKTKGGYGILSEVVSKIEKPI